MALAGAFDVSETDGRWYSRWFAAFLVVLVMSLASLLSAIVESAIASIYRDHFGVPLPWSIEFLQLLILGACALVLPGLIYRGQRLRSGRRTTWMTVFQVGLLGTLISGAAFILQLPPPLASLTFNGFGRIPVLECWHPPFYAYLIVQRVVVLPLIGFIGAAVWHVALRRRP